MRRIRGIRHAISLGMENTPLDAGGFQANSANGASILALPQSALPAPAAETSGSGNAESVEIVPVESTSRNASELEGGSFEMAALPDHLRQIPFRVELRVPLSRFTLRDLQQLTAGVLLPTEHLSVRDLVLTAAGERLLLVELEAIEQQLAARVKRLAWRHKWRRKA